MLSFPHAKINIGLNIIRKRPDGYHDLETVFYPIPLQDVLEIRPLRGSNAPYAFQLIGPSLGIRPEQNLVVKVYTALQEEFQLPPLDIYLQKRIPVGAGLGGGSSDAAFMLKALNETYDLGLSEADMEQRIARYGADCAFFISGHPAFATGIGNQLSPFNLNLKGLTFVLVKPDISVSTKEAYAHVHPHEPQHNLKLLLSQPIEQWPERVLNDFEDSVFAAHPEIAAIKSTLYDMGATYASMSGSGSAVYGLFRTPPMEAECVFADCFVFQQKLLI